MPEFAAAHPNITNPDTYLRGVADWSFLNGAFTNERIRFIDIDGLVTINGYELRLEAKSGEADFSRGQEIAAQDAVNDGRTTVILVRFDSSKQPVAYRIFGEMAREEPCDAESLRALCAEWEEYVRGLSRPRQFPPLRLVRPNNFRDTTGRAVAEWLARHGRKEAA